MSIQLSKTDSRNFCKGICKMAIWEEEELPSRMKAELAKTRCTVGPESLTDGRVIQGEDGETHLKEALKVNATVPIPSVETIPEDRYRKLYRKTYSEEALGSMELITDKTLPWADCGEFDEEYDMDSEDEEWIKGNCSLRPVQFEMTMSKLNELNPSEINQQFLNECKLVPIYSLEDWENIYKYWSEKKGNSVGQSLHPPKVRTEVVGLDESENHPYTAFHTREILTPMRRRSTVHVLENQYMQLYKKRQEVKPSLESYKLLFADERASGEYLLERIKQTYDKYCSEFDRLLKETDKENTSSLGQQLQKCTLVETEDVKWTNTVGTSVQTLDISKKYANQFNQFLQSQQLSILGEINRSVTSEKSEQSVCSPPTRPAKNNKPRSSTPIGSPENFAISINASATGNPEESFDFKQGDAIITLEARTIDVQHNVLPEVGPSGVIKFGSDVILAEIQEILAADSETVASMITMTNEQFTLCMNTDEGVEETHPDIDSTKSWLPIDTFEPGEPAELPVTLEGNGGGISQPSTSTTPSVENKESVCHVDIFPRTFGQCWNPQLCKSFHSSSSSSPENV